MHETEEIKKKLDIVDLINRYVTLKKRGHHYLACCPFHQEKTPSFIVSPELQIFKCFGCGKSGDIFTFIQEFEKIDFRDALEELAKLAGVKLETSPAQSHAESKRQRLFLLNHETAKFYHYILTNHPLGKPALDYVLNRGIKKDTIAQFKIGFSPQNSSLVTQYLQKKGFTIAELMASGTFGQSSYGNRIYDRFSSRLVFPLADFRDRILGFSGRILPGAPDNMAKYINSPETEIYHKSFTVFGLNHSKEFIKKANAVIVTEGEFDMISPFQGGVQNIVAVKGTAFTEEQLQLLRRFADTLILGLDSDFAGNNAARKSIELADKFDFDIQVLTLGDFKDPDEAIQKDPEFFKSQLTKTQSIWDYLINSAVSVNDVGTPKGKKQVLTLVLPFITKIGNSVIKSDYLHKLADSIGSSLDSVLEESKKINLPEVKTTAVSIAPTVPTQNSHVELWEKYLLTLILSSQKPNLLAKKIKKIFKFVTPRYKLIAKTLRLSVNYEPKDFVLKLPAELQPQFQDMFLSSTAIKLEPIRRKAEIQKTINFIKQKNFQHELTEVSKLIAQAENLSDETQLKTLEMRYNQLLVDLAGLQSTK